MNFERVLRKVLWRLVTEGCISFAGLSSALVSMTTVSKNCVVS